MDGLADGAVLVALHDQPVLHVLQEVQVLVRGHGLVPLLGRRPPLVGGALEVVLEVHLHGAREQIVHDDDADVLTRRLDAVESVKLGQQGPLVLVQVLQEMRRVALATD